MGSAAFFRFPLESALSLLCAVMLKLHYNDLLPTAGSTGISVTRGREAISSIFRSCGATRSTDGGNLE